MSGGIKRPWGQNVWRDKTSGRPSIRGDKTSGGKKESGGTQDKKCDFFSKYSIMYLKNMTQTNVLSLQMFCPHVCFVPRMLCLRMFFPKYVLSLWTFCPAGCFVPRTFCPSTLCLRTLCLRTLCLQKLYLRTFCLGSHSQRMYEVNLSASLDQPEIRRPGKFGKFSKFQEQEPLLLIWNCCNPLIRKFSDQRSSMQVKWILIQLSCALGFIKYRGIANGFIS
jgi:hypothetical protein